MGLASIRWKAVLRESLAVAGAGLAFALIANAVSPRGLPLRAKPIPKTAVVAVSAASTSNLQLQTQAPVVAATSSVEVIAARLKAKGLTLADSNQVYALYQDPRYGEELLIFVDARQDPDYLKGHVPGAYLFDPYRADVHLGSVLLACRDAEQVVVYCHGGDCEDSEHAALLLSQAGVPASRLLIYGGGFEQWSTNRWPVEVGERRSGQLKEDAP